MAISKFLSSLRAKSFFGGRRVVTGGADIFSEHASPKEATVTPSYS
jgi:hypothetical protein